MCSPELKDMTSQEQCQLRSKEKSGSNTTTTCPEMGGINVPQSGGARGHTSERCSPEMLGRKTLIWFEMARCPKQMRTWWFGRSEMQKLEMLVLLQ